MEVESPFESRLSISGQHKPRVSTIAVDATLNEQLSFMTWNGHPRRRVRVLSLVMVAMIHFCMKMGCLGRKRVSANGLVL